MEKEKQLSRKTLIGIIIILIVVIIIGIIFFIINNSNNNNEVAKTQVDNNIEQNSETQESTGISDLDPKNIEIGKEIDSIDEANKSTQFIMMLVWDYYANTMPNAKWETFEITETDGYGRYVVYMKYLRNSNDTYFSYVNNIVYWVDSTHFGKYTAIGDVSSMKRQVDWGTKIDINR